VKIKLDENIPVSLVRVLALRGHDVETVNAEGLVGRRDQEIWSHCQAEGRLLITQDLDFSDVRQFQPGTHARLVLVRLQQPGRRGLVNVLSWVFQSDDVEGWRGCFVIVSETKVRVRRS
jgi:predicted nuclease of predicted toxin-antitoxin system